MPDKEPERTVFSPILPEGTQAPPTQPPAAQIPPTQPPETQAPSAQPEPTAPPSQSQPVQTTGFSTPAVGTEKIKVGDILNHLYEVRRLIARGGMGEVFEGVNINFSAERVAIKVILPHLAADPAVQAMFFKEAHTLTRLNHPALVQYRTMAHEPQLGVFYIVTEFVDGPNLSDELKSLKPDAVQIAALTRRLAEGLAVAHEMGAIHRDISPDNILLEGGKTDQAKIIDFGIAKNLDPGAATIVGDGFAGKLSYVAPEQLGEFGGDVGPWSDIYSLGLTILAVARQRDVDMGGTIVDAVDKRRAGPDLSPLPEPLQPLFKKMLASDPRQRMQSMGEVVKWLADWSQGKVAAPAAKAAKAAKPARKPGAGLAPLKARWAAIVAKLHANKAFHGPRAAMIAGGVVLGVMLIAAIAVSFAGHSGANDAQTAQQAGGPASPAKVQDVPAKVRTVLAGGLSQVPCSWLDVESIDGGSGKPITVALKGVSGQTAQSIARVEDMLKRSGVGALSVSYSDIAPVPPSFCSPLEAFGKVRGGGVAQLSVPQIKFEMSPLQGNLPQQYLGQLGAKAVIDIELKSDAHGAALVGIAENGEMQLIAGDMLQLPKDFLESLGGGRYRLYLPTLNAGWSGIVLLVGNGPFPAALFNHPAGPLAPGWNQSFLSAARQQGWKSEMVWYKAVNEQPDAAPTQ